MMDTQIFSDDALDAVSGGMTCSDAKVVGAFYGALGDAYASLGMYIQAGVAYGRSGGLVDGACATHA